MSLLERWLYRLLHDDEDSNRHFRNEDDPVDPAPEGGTRRVITGRGDKVVEASGAPKRETR